MLTSGRISDVVGVRFQEVGRIYHFDVSAYPEVGPGMRVVVETSRGSQIGQVTGFIRPEELTARSYRAITRVASQRDMMMWQVWQEKELSVLIACREQASKLKGFQDVSFIQASYNYDGSLLIFLFTAEHKVETHNLARELRKQFRCRIEMRQVGPRDAAKVMGGYGACGTPRCCSTFLTEFSPISIKMAKAQGISLDPSEITGMCGRLRCCLVFEYEQYVEARKTLPRKKKMVGTPFGEAKVIDVHPLKGTVTVVVENQRHEVSGEDIEPLEELRALQSKASKGCGKDGPCECGAKK